MLKELTIKRSEWLTPDKSSSSKLLDENGLKCCLGFACLALGCEKEDILEITSPYYVYLKWNRENTLEKLNNLLQFLEGSSYNLFAVTNNCFVTNAMEINDNSYIDNAEREIRLIKLFGANGIVLNFID